MAPTDVSALQTDAYKIFILVVIYISAEIFPFKLSSKQKFNSIFTEEQMLLHVQLVLLREKVHEKSSIFFFSVAFVFFHSLN